MIDQIYLPLAEAKQFFFENNLNSELLEIESYSGKDRKKKGFIITKLEENKLLDKFIDKYWKNGSTHQGKKIIQRYKNYYKIYNDT
jgi:hypothetical protein